MGHTCIDSSHLGATMKVLFVLLIALAAALFVAVPEAEALPAWQYGDSDWGFTYNWPGGSNSFTGYGGSHTGWY